MSPQVQALYDEDLADGGYVWNVSRLWAHQPEQEKAMAAWARKVATDPNATTPADIQALRDSGLDDGQIFAITAFVALRLAFSTINDSLGAQPDAQLVLSLPQEVREAVTYGRPAAS
jgi:alkylhydroperoxidase family enzyme